MFERLKDENEYSFLWRIGTAKDVGLIDYNWDKIADIINKEFREDESEYRTEAAYRKPYQQAKRFKDAGVFNVANKDSYIEELREAKQEVQKEKQKLFDERAALNRKLREQARRESLYEMMCRSIAEHRQITFDYTPNEIKDSDNDVIIHVTDIHGGVDIDNYFNKYNFDILSQRLKNYLNEIKEIQNTFNSQNAYVILGGDMIHGLIHVNSRIESKENIVQQIMKVADLVSGFIFELSKIFQNVEVHTTAGNHSRVTANKEETSHGENFDLLIPFACKKDFKNIKNVSFKDNYLDYDVATFKVRGHMVYATHGDKDSPEKVVYNMTKFARKANLPLPDICYLGHRHENGLKTIDDVKVIQSGCIDGMDNYTLDLRKVGTPEQTVTVVTEKRRIKALCDIQID